MWQHGVRRNDVFTLPIATPRCRWLSSVDPERLAVYNAQVAARRAEQEREDWYEVSGCSEPVVMQCHDGGVAHTHCFVVSGFSLPAAAAGDGARR
jgi:hypothetical protein